MASSSDEKTLENNFLWIHCFKCSHYFDLKNKDFFQLECSHISCAKCLENIDDLCGICPCCKKQSKYSLINNVKLGLVKKYLNPRTYNGKHIYWNGGDFQQKTHQHLIANWCPLVSYWIHFKKRTTEITFYIRTITKEYLLLNGSARNTIRFAKRGISYNVWPKMSIIMNK